MIILEISSWSEFKTLCITDKGITCQYNDLGSSYTVLGPDANGIMWRTGVSKTDPRNTDQIDFEDNYKSGFNQSITTPTSNKGFQDLSGYNVYRKGYRFIATGGETSIHEASYNDTMMLQGMKFTLCSSVQDKDYVEVKLSDTDGTYYPAGTILATFAETLYVFPSMDYEVVADDAKSIPPNIYIQFIYHSYNPNDELQSSSSSSSFSTPDVVVKLEHVLRTTP